MDQFFLWILVIIVSQSVDNSKAFLNDDGVLGSKFNNLKIKIHGINHDMSVLADDCDSALQLVRLKNLRNISMNVLAANKYISRIVENANNEGNDASRCLMKRNLILTAYNDINNTIQECMRIKQKEFEEKHILPVFLIGETIMELLDDIQKNCSKIANFSSNKICIDSNVVNATQLVNDLQNDSNNLKLNKESLIKSTADSMIDCMKSSMRPFDESLENARRKTNACIKQLYYDDVKNKF